MNEDLLFRGPVNLIPSPPAIAVEDEQVKYARLVAQGKEAAALEVEGKYANVLWVQALKAAYPDVQREYFSAQKKVNPKVYEIVVAARGCTRDTARNFLSQHKDQRTRDARIANTRVQISRARQIRIAAVELTTKYRLGADPKECMEALVKFIEDTQRG